MTDTGPGSERPYDIAIVGAGPIGAAFALALREGGLSVLLLESGGARAGDRRSIALSFGSRLVLERLQVWQQLPAPTPIESIHVSQRAGFGRALLRAADAGLPALGYVVAYPDLHATLAGCLQGCAGLELRKHTEVIEVRPDGASATVCCRTGGREWAASAALAVLADGGTLARSAAPHRERDYAQSAVVADVVADRPNARRAYERFTPDGPIALLPAGEAFALVWTTTPEHAQHLSALDDHAFLDALQAAFGARAGRFTQCSARATYPLALRVAGAPRHERIVLLGNAAQTLHPVAGQGLNLGLRDAWQLAQMVLADPASVGSQALAARYRSGRRVDRLGTIALTDALVEGFSNDLAPLRWLRGFGLTFLDILPPAKKAFIQRMTFGG